MLATAPPQELRPARGGASRLRNGLLVQHERFCQAVAGGMSQAAAYWHHISQSANEDTASSQAARLLQEGSPCRRRVQQILAQAEAKAAAARLLTKQEVGEFIAKVVRTPIGEVDHTSPLAQERTYVVGREEDSVKIKMPGKLDAVKVAMELYGWKSAEKHAVVVAGHPVLDEALAGWFGPEAREIVANEENHNLENQATETDGDALETVEGVGQGTGEENAP